ncbi:peptidoglycan DD-metalloendopeptidase family protein [Pontixanthobacter aquaemixtae]|uniref:Peptidoglycan DD-metalloendopeptidase family protein n=1 Tax=Pontixanthobacter aquaemixtae TaxID=1958940 RepID=A0A844ZPC2_9SPHN|nr:M23 family metallopeptidase [Pontixanthobacter aquaemixtae]MXO89404.1 peptidoglycan DD-metalloendopeptidase family protein [Pontixanthobacter aquaemixtae]
MKKWALLLAAPFLLAAGDPATETEHTVEEGETLGGIANRAKVPAAVIAAANGLQEPYNLRAGQVLQIPRQRIHIVKDGDTGFGIAQRYGVPFSNIAIANGLKPPYAISTGQRLIIPAVLKAAPEPAQPARTEPYFRWPHDGRVMAGFSLRDDGKGHDGLDIEANRLDMVRASSSGTVVFADDEPKRFGRLVVIDHGNGWRTRYGHLARITVKLGDVVKTGERIGLAGDAGVATRPELHFEIMKDNKRIDPASKLPQR